MISAKRHNGISRLEVVVMLVAFLPALLSGAGDFVLCFGEGGHVAIEFAHHDPCFPHRDDASEGSAGHAAPDDFDELNSTCFDIPIAIDGSFAQVYDAPQSGGGDDRGAAYGELHALPRSSDTASERAAACGEDFRAPPSIPQSLLAHHTTVLLI